MKNYSLGPLAEIARAEEKKHRGTEGEETDRDLCLRARGASVFQPSLQKRGSLTASQEDTQSTLKSEDESLDAIFSLYHLEAHS